MAPSPRQRPLYRRYLSHPHAVFVEGTPLSSHRRLPPPTVVASFPLISSPLGPPVCTPTSVENPRGSSRSYKGGGNKKGTRRQTLRRRRRVVGPALRGPAPLTPILVCFSSPAPAPPLPPPPASPPPPPLVRLTPSAGPFRPPTLLLLRHCCPPFPTPLPPSPPPYHTASTTTTCASIQTDSPLSPTSPTRLPSSPPPPPCHPRQAFKAGTIRSVYDRSAPKKVTVPPQPGVSEPVTRSTPALLIDAAPAARRGSAAAQSLSHHPSMARTPPPPPLPPPLLTGTWRSARNPRTVSTRSPHSSRPRARPRAYTRSPTPCTWNPSVRGATASASAAAAAAA